MPAGRPTRPARRPPSTAAPPGTRPGPADLRRRGPPSGTTTSVDASQGMSGWSQTTTARRSPARVDAGRAEEVVPLEQGASRTGAPARVESATTRRPAAARPRRAPRAPPAPSPRRPWPRARRGGAPRPRRGAAGSAAREARPRGRPRRPVAEPDALVGLVDVGEGARGRAPGTRHTAPPPYSWTRLRMLTSAGEWSRRAVRVRPARATTRPASAGPRLEPVQGGAVRAELRERDLGPGDVARRERRVPAPITCGRGHGPNVPGAPVGGR